MYLLSSLSHRKNERPCFPAAWWLETLQCVQANRAQMLGKLWDEEGGARGEKRGGGKWEDEGGNMLFAKQATTRTIPCESECNRPQQCFQPDHWSMWTHTTLPRGRKVFHFKANASLELSFRHSLFFLIFLVFYNSYDLVITVVYKMYFQCNQTRF